MTDRHGRFSPRALGRIAGLFYLYTILAGLFAEFYAAGKLIVSGDPKTTAVNLLGNETLFRIGIVNEMLGVGAYVAVSLILYALLKSAGKNLALTSVFFATIGNILWIAGAIYQFGALRLLHGGAQLAAFTTDQVQALALQSLHLHDTALNAGMMFFGIYCLLIGVLIFRSRYFPQALGVLLIAGGAFDMGNEMVAFMFPGFFAALPDLLQLPGFVAEVALTAWLLARGVKTVSFDGA